MTATQVLNQNGSALIAGLQWQPLVGKGKARAREMRRAASEAGAKKIVVSEVGQFAAMGLYAPLDFDLETGGANPLAGARRAYSLAAAFAELVGAEDAVLVLRRGDTESVAVVVLDGGMPVLDELRSLGEAQNIVSSYTNLHSGRRPYAVYANGMAGATAQEINAEDLLEKAGAASALVNAPANLWPRVIAVAVIAAVATAGFAYQQHTQQQAQKAALEKRKKADPLPRYRMALADALPHLGVPRDALIAAIGIAQGYPVRFAGWNLSSIECMAQQESGVCVSHWKRDTGTTDALREGLKRYGLEISADRTINEVRMLQKVPMVLSAGVQEVAQLQSRTERTDGAQAILQTWSNAGIEVTAKSEYTPWPEGGTYDVRAIPADVVVSGRKVEVQVPAGLAAEVVRSAPSDIWWTGFGISVTPEKSELMSLVVRGSSYVRQ